MIYKLELKRDGDAWESWGEYITLTDLANAAYGLGALVKDKCQIRVTTYR